MLLCILVFHIVHTHTLEILLLCDAAMETPQGYFLIMGLSLNSIGEEW